jgi:hypothetical protein
MWAAATKCGPGGPMALARGWAAGNAGPEDALRAGAAPTIMSGGGGTCQVPHLKHATGPPPSRGAPRAMPRLVGTRG